MNLHRCFSDEPINTGRQMEVDLVKGFAVLFMVWVHTDMMLGSMQSWGSWAVGSIWGAPFSAPMFMIGIGIGVCYSRRSNARYLAIRGLKMLAVGVLVHLARYLSSEGLMVALGRSSFAMVNMIYMLFFADILQFAGFAFLFLAIAKSRNWSLGMLTIISVVASLAGTALCRVSTGHFYADIFLGCLWGTGDSSCFPFLNWIVFPVAGIGIGKALLHCRDKKHVYAVVSPVCLLLSCLYIGVSLWLGINMYSEKVHYYFLSIIDAFFIILLAIGLLGQNYWMMAICRKWRFPMLVRISRNCNAIFCIHWVLVTLLDTAMKLFFSGRRLSFVESTIAAAMVLVASDGLAQLYAKRFRGQPHGQTA